MKHSIDKTIAICLKTDRLRHIQSTLVVNLVSTLICLLFSILFMTLQRAWWQIARDQKCMDGYGGGYDWKNSEVNLSKAG